MRRGRRGEVWLTKRGATPYLVVASLLNRFGVSHQHHAYIMYGRSSAPGILHYLLQCGVKVPEGVEQQMSSGMPIGIPDAQIVEPSSTDVSQLFADQAEDYKKAIGARSESCWRPLSGTKEGRRSAQTSPLSR